MTTLDNPATSALPQEGGLARVRLQTVDALRGAIIIIMALDHVRDFTSIAAMSFSPTDLARTTAPIFFTRWITHFCAPVFAFTAGIGAFLWLKPGKTRAQLSRFLLTRGLWLMFLEVTVLRFILFFDVKLKGSLIILTVFWMLGLCMVVMAALIHLPVRWLAVMSVVIIAAHNLLDPVSAMRFGAAAWVWDILHQQGVFPFMGANILAGYPLLPWIAVMAAGYCFGPVLRWEPQRRRRFMLILGLSLAVVFVLLRAVNIYGDPARWSAQRSALFTFLSFMNTVKYPPSLLFLLMTLGPAIAVMAWLDRKQFSDANPLLVFGRVPFFFFLGHMAVIHALAIVLGFFRYGGHSFLLMPAPSMGGPRQLFPPDYGYSLGAVYVIWISVILLMYPACRWFAGLKQRRKDWWLSYL